MSKIAGISESANELERLIADLSESGPIIFVFGVGWWTAHLIGATAPVFRGRPTGAGGTLTSATTRRAGRWTCGSMRSPASGSCANPTRFPLSPGGRS